MTLQNRKAFQSSGLWLPLDGLVLPFSLPQGKEQGTRKRKGEYPT